MDRFSNLNNLLAFVTVAREGSVSRAAEVLNLTQPAISHQIKRLAEETDLSLFTRTTTGLQVTPDGAAMLAKAEKVLDAMSDFHRSARQRSGQLSGTLRIGTIVDPEFIRLGHLLAKLRQDHAAIETHLLHGVSGNTLNWLKRGQIDAGFYLSAPDDLPDSHTDNEQPIHAVRLADFNYRVIAPSGWGTQAEHADWKQLAALPWIGTPELSVHHRLLNRVFEAHGCTQNIVAQVDQEASMLAMVRSGIGLSLCRDSIALHQKQSFGIVVCATVSVPASLSFITLERNVERPIMAETLNLLQQVW
ncbi:LysR family transcriptional regulator [Shimia sp. R10_1]|uniref:LysR family transcriptional regulator n=1 Tax=Shimia sp. R10_1 TaxID=2821095 RepID=UPI001ADBE15F|nr:LysR family transcriptional regulator [Shimia sp. R10_1]MBO9474218.1 LysR family transcriptional regulator [Shimia sp. R10_1]